MEFFKREYLLLVISILFFTSASHSNVVQASKSSPVTEQVMKVKFTIGKNAAIVVLNDSPAAKEFAAQLPLTLSFKDYAAIEKISYLPNKISGRATSGPQKQQVGDFAYYAPWGNIAIFYKGTEKATGDLRILGKFESGKEFFNINNSFEATLELAP